MLGMNPPRTANTYSVHAGTPNRAQSRSAPSASTLIPVTGTRTLPCPALPLRSTSRETCGPSSAIDSVNAAETSPARP